MECFDLDTKTQASWPQPRGLGAYLQKWRKSAKEANPEILRLSPKLVNNVVVKIGNCLLQNRKKLKMNRGRKKKEDKIQREGGRERETDRQREREREGERERETEKWGVT